MPRHDKIYGLTPEQYRRVVQATRRTENELVQRRIQTDYYGRAVVGGRGTTVSMVKCLAGSPSAGDLYDAERVEYDPVTDTFVSVTGSHCYIRSISGNAPALNATYLGTLVGFSNLPVLGVQALPPEWEHDPPADPIKFMTENDQRPVFAVGEGDVEEETLVPLDIVDAVCVVRDCDSGGTGGTFELCDLPVNELVEPDYVASCVDVGGTLTASLFSIANLKLLEGWNPVGAGLTANSIWIGDGMGAASELTLGAHATLITGAAGALTGVAHSATAGYVFTNNGAAVAPSWEVNPVTVGGYVQLASTYSINNSDEWQLPGLSFVVPSTGTYMIVAQIRYGTHNSLGNGMKARLYDSTASAALSGAVTWLTRSTTNALYSGTACMVWRGTLTAGNTIRLEAWRTSGGTWTVSQIVSDADGQTSLVYNRVA